MKRYELLLNDSLRKSLCSIRNKPDIIDYLLKIMQYISSFPYKELIYSPEKSKEVDIVINVDKMSRIFFCEQDKIHTFQFPFTINLEDEKLKFHYMEQEIDSEIITIIISIFETKESIFKSLDTTLDIFMDTMNDFGVNNKQYAEYCWNLIVYLLSFEPGYLRYDYDDAEERVDALKHPLNHLDLFYSGNNTFKIGLDDRIDYNKLIELLNVNACCSYIK